jgi:hypothetical protein
MPSPLTKGLSASAASGFHGAGRAAGLQHAGVFDVLQAVGAFGRELQIEGDDGRGFVRALDEAPNEASVAKLGLLHPAGGLRGVELRAGVVFLRNGDAQHLGVQPQVAGPSDGADDAAAHGHAERAVAGGSAHMGERRALEDLWRDPLINRRWQRLALRLAADDCTRMARTSAGRGLAGSGVQWLAAESATNGWALGSRGCVVAQDCQPTVARPAGPIAGQSDVFARAVRPYRSLREPVAMQTV